MFNGNIGLGAALALVQAISAAEEGRRLQVRGEPVEPSLPPAPPVRPAAPRNAPCPCGSRVKYKRCCGGVGRS